MNHIKINIPRGQRLQEIDLEDMETLSVEQDFGNRFDKHPVFASDDAMDFYKKNSKKHKDNHKPFSRKNNFDD